MIPAFTTAIGIGDQGSDRRLPPRTRASVYLYDCTMETDDLGREESRRLSPKAGIILIYQSIPGDRANCGMAGLDKTTEAAFRVDGIGVRKKFEMPKPEYHFESAR